ncbi:unnamed protein product [Rhodiola kirilowii]
MADDDILRFGRLGHLYPLTKVKALTSEAMINSSSSSLSTALHHRRHPLRRLRQSPNATSAVINTQITRNRLFYSTVTLRRGRRVLVEVDDRRIFCLPESAETTCFNSPSSSSSSSSSSSIENEEAVAADLRSLVDDFDPNIPIQSATTPPSSWYTNPSFLSLEISRVFYRSWQAVGYSEQLKNPGDFFTGSLGNVEYVVCRDLDGNINAFHNVCRHHASLIMSQSGQTSCFVCPYHGWAYGLDGSLVKATRITGIKDFNVKDFSLIPLKVAAWGPFILLNMREATSAQQSTDESTVENEWLGDCPEIQIIKGVHSSLRFICRRSYTMDCNWKVFVDNYLDGGYHVPYAHKGLASGLDLGSYSTTMYEKLSIQKCEGGPTVDNVEFDRLGLKALYAFIYPNFMINRYGPWMDTNLVLPLGHKKCRVVFDYFLEASLADDTSFIERSLNESETVQMEDITLSEGVQRGLESPAFCRGRYAPTVEKAMHHFHCLLHHDLIRS